MSTCLSTSAASAMTFDVRDVRVLKWTFRRHDDTVTCELGLTDDDAAYQLRIDPPWNPAGATIELFDDVMAAFQRHAAIERILIQDGWSLERFESQCLRRR